MNDPAPTGPYHPETSEASDLPSQIGRYRVEKLLGQGGFGRVYLAHDDQLNRDVAIKLPHRRRIAQPKDADSYLAEARILAGLDHPNIVPVYDVGRTDDGLPFVVSKFIEGSDLSRRVREGRVSFLEAAEIVATVALALHHAHQTGLVHRDVKPGNILLDAAGKPYVADFGLALKDTDFGKGARFAGTPAYMSPEQARGEGHRVDGRSDVFSLGVVFYQLLTGRVPFRADTSSELFEQIAICEPRPPRQLDDTLPRELERICLKAMAKRASERYTTARDLADDLRHFLASAACATAVPAVPASAAACATASPTAGTAVAHASTPPLLATPTSDPAPLRIVPKGLRSFDAGDADFFLELLPGPRDREGLPDSLRFWKSRIEETDADKTFLVGLIYGPSGCGKSSLVKAGLLPRLGEGVLAVYVESTAAETEPRLLKGLRKRCPAVPDHLDLTETLAALRCGQGLPAGKKVLLVLDQFEQWLHARRDEHHTELVGALRQCDGGRVQCLVLVRDDFWLAVSRFMRDLEIRLVEGHNSALADLFDPDHAKKVLAAFGRAFSRLPEASHETTKEQKEFLTQAVSGMTQEGKVICVRLALVAEMLKGKPWTPATLRAVGGTEGVGVTFLEETFSAATAPPEHRYHQKAARAVLKALLPEQGTDIKGQMRSREELLAVAGTPARDFDDVLRILDAELRLVTPTDPQAAELPRGDKRPRLSASEQPASEAACGYESFFYQLTHDYLVPSLRAWLTRKQKETRRGRAELRLAERAAAWQVRRHVDEQSRATVAAGLVRQLLDADTARVPDILDKLDGYRTWTDPLLRDEYSRAAEGSTRKLHAALALLPVDPGQQDYLLDRLLDASPQEVLVLREALRPHQESLRDRLWTVAEQPSKGREHQRLRAASALAAFDSESPRWERSVGPVAGQLVKENPVHLGAWLDGFRPIQDKLLVSLAGIFRDRSPERAAERGLAANLLAEYAAGEPTVLADLLLDADDKQFAVLYPRLQGYGERATPLLHAELERKLEPGWTDPPLTGTAGTAVAPELVQKIEAANGLVRERFALCQTMPLDEFVKVAEALRASGYRPVRVRPYPCATAVPAVGERPHTADTAVAPSKSADILVAAVWTHDGQDWQFAHGLTAEEMRQRDAECRKQLFHPVDAAGYPGDGPVRFAAVWVKVPPQSLDTELAVGLDEQQMQTKDAALRKDGWWRATTASHAVLWTKPVGRRPSGGTESTDEVFVGSEAEYSGDNNRADLLVDVHLAKSMPTPSARERFTRQLADADKALQAKPDDADARFGRALARFHLDENDKALDDLTSVLGKAPKFAAAHQYRALVHARLGKATEAKDDLAKFQELTTDTTGQKEYTAALVAAHLGEAAEGLKHLEAAIKARGQDAEFLYNAACAYGVAAGVFAGKEATRAQLYADRAVALLQEAIKQGYLNYAHMQTDTDLDPLREHAGFVALLHGAGVERQYTAIWHPVAGRTFVEVHGVDPLRHLARCRELAAQGYRPAAVSVASCATAVSAVGSGRTADTAVARSLLTASVWHRPVVPDDAKERLAKRQANAAVALLKMNHPDPVWPLFQQQPDSRARSYLIHRLRPLEADPRQLVRRWEEEKVVSRRRALLLGLGEFTDKEFPPAERDALLPKLLDLYRTDPDPGLHGSLAWLLGKWGHRDKLRQIDKELAGAPAGHRRWYVNGQEQTFAIIPGPVEFLMGSPRTEKDRESGERGRMESQHQRRIGRTFAIATHEVTVDQFLKFRKNHSYNAQYARTGEHPINNVTWYNAAAYCNWLSEQEGIPKEQWCYEPNAQGEYAEGMRLRANYLGLRGYRLPTEAEWEAACRAGTGTSRYYGETEELLGEYAWYTDNSRNQAALPVGSLKPNDWGLFDVLGNVFEWTQDRPWYYTSQRGGKAMEDRERIESISDRNSRVLRGGSFVYLSLDVRSAIRHRSAPSNLHIYGGFRAARTFD